MATESQLALRKEWVDALRSGKYKQGKETLCDRVDNSFCCLGVLCDLVQDRLSLLVEEVSGVDVRTKKRFKRRSYNKESQILPESVKDAVGMREPNGGYHDSSLLLNALSEKNDKGHSFSEIADIIESNPAGLFKD